MKNGKKENCELRCKRSDFNSSHLHRRDEFLRRSSPDLAPAAL
jgi:hypothetical protein